MREGKRINPNIIKIIYLRMNDQVKYICTGGCGGSVTEEQYDAGKTVCGTPSCPKYGQPFEKRMYCSVCGQELKEGESHQH